MRLARSLVSGMRRGPFEILSALDAGGMAEKVYRARDTVLKREVALKVLDFGLATPATPTPEASRTPRPSLTLAVATVPA